MKMPEKHDLLAAILQRMSMGAVLAFTPWHTFAADIMAVRLQKQ